ncbi:MAG TPA: phenylalanine--tRNA ligase subunit alpha [Ignavibacteriales bacterium]|nr:phenylalanine--tRNA ligase subunit alpha [Ignavibacteriales bacterium]HOL81559.1 phenylalanine--tRNA ligase subunit alpha [Ignavibacteriales bacterium]HOM65611.1 phenylalanine--tRNA ligase subunit alpha [Ignavibacteriales bacterium]HPD67819.1 phenylalanine--tRNA ligase subunit alpha [Ignavibacteriales bacterium]HPP33673.1 phenylalanine--tRNA ligase subunit alpha [Ignavibacteriales bacterium]
MLEKITKIKEEVEQILNKVENLNELEQIKAKFIGKKGEITILFKELKNFDKEQIKVFGQKLNELKDFTENKVTELREKFQQKQESNISFDFTLPGRNYIIGSKHLIIQTLDDIKSIFKKLGFSVYEGPEIESDFNNFEALNFPPDHPARDMQDTFFVSDKFLLRTHTSPVQIRVMQENEPPIRAIMPGKVFRNEAISARSYCLFHQLEGLAVDTDITFAELKGTLVHFAKEFYGSSLKYRFRPSFFPFTEPSAEMDITCYLCGGKGCRVCKGSGWLEILGCGMVDPNVFKSVNYDSEKYVGYAFGMGIERIALLKYGITDIRILFDNDFRFLNQF